ncbi:MAG: SDR family oxidoreductase [Deltaproteobacteria bacterium]|jgi:NAD(P)-dependent dehydrogenase (short-subunit alcohol dehydrogenase family)|nr:SDR family oxidoreductase [Deltaproteobacteria bacterium]
MVSFELTDKTALITGASRGIGEAIAMNLAAHGARCILVSRKIEGLEAVKEKIVTAGGKAEAVACHLGDLTQIEAMCDHVAKTYGRLDILVNNAAVNPYLGPMTGASPGVFDKTVEVNLRGPFFLIQKTVPLMEKKGGSIINVASVGGISPGMFQGIYSITKAGVIAMTKAYAKELASSNIRVNALLPGLTETRFSAALIENKQIYEYALQRIPMKRHAQPEEMAGAVLYLASDAASYTTGTTIICDGGMMA